MSSGPLGPAPLRTPISLGGGALDPAWQAWLSRLFLVGQSLGSNGTTAQRPAGTTAVPLFIGQGYFDTTLGYPVWIKSLNPTVWVNGAGAIV